MVKMMFMLHRKQDLTREQCLAEWTGEQHLSFVGGLKAAGLRRYVQNKVTGEEHEGAPDGVGELWFDDAETMDSVSNSPAMGAAFEDAKRFLDLDRTYAVVVDELTRFE